MVKVNLAAVAPQPWLDGNQVDSLFRQEDVWVDRHLETHYIVDMSDRHLMFTHRFVRRNFYRWRAYTMLSYLLETPGAFGVSFDDDVDSWEPLPADVRETSLFKALDQEMRDRRIEELVT